MQEPELLQRLANYDEVVPDENPEDELPEGQLDGEDPEQDPDQQPTTNNQQPELQQPELQLPENQQPTTNNQQPGEAPNQQPGEDDALISDALLELAKTDPAKLTKTAAALGAKLALQQVAPMLQAVNAQAVVRGVQRLAQVEPETAPYIEEIANELGIPSNTLTKEQAQFIADAATGRARRAGALGRNRVVASTGAEDVRPTATWQVPQAVKGEVSEFEKAFGVKVDAGFTRKHGIEF